uniref:Uncharacterized protein n=1 Tax=Trichogramma kaykai TaxID=54128 RepID=A0ABD2W2Y5_9HYME
MNTLPQVTTSSANSFTLASPRFSSPFTTFCSSLTAVTSNITGAGGSTMIFSSQSAGVGSSSQIRPEPQLDTPFAALLQDTKLDKLYDAISFVAAQNCDLQSSMDNLSTMIGFERVWIRGGVIYVPKKMAYRKKCKLTLIST